MRWLPKSRSELMSDAAGFGQVMMRARLTREIGESECIAAVLPKALIQQAA